MRLEVESLKRIIKDLKEKNASLANFRDKYEVLQQSFKKSEDTNRKLQDLNIKYQDRYFKEQLKLRGNKIFKSLIFRIIHKKLRDRKYNA